MRTFIVRAGGRNFIGSWYGCVLWGKEQVRDDGSLLVKIHAVRAGEKQGRVVSEISADGLRMIQKGRYVPLKKLRGKDDKV